MDKIDKEFEKQLKGNPVGLMELMIACLMVQNDMDVVKIKPETFKKVVKEKLYVAGEHKENEGKFYIRLIKGE